MLKLKRIGRDQPIQIVIRDQGHLFNRTFLFAAALALGIHLFALLFFQVVPIRINFEGSVLPPIHVESDLEISGEMTESSVLANVDRDLTPLRYYLEPKKALPSLPKPPKSLLLRHMEYIKEESCPNPFMTLENEVLLSEFNVDKKFIQPTQPIAITLTGMLAGMELIRDGLSYQSLPKIPETLGPCRAIYSVQVEGRTGQIFWVEAKQVSSIDFLNKLAEKILFEMRFRTNQSFVVSGDVEIVFNASFG